jgi:hypothetical protein
MLHDFTRENLDAIARTLGTQPVPLGSDVYRFEVRDDANARRLALEIHIGLEAVGVRMNMVSVYSHNTFLQLHNCTAFVASDLMRQVTFFGRNGSMTSGLIVEKGAGCSLYANVDESVLKGDFTKLPEDLMMCGVALSLTEAEGLDDFSFSDEGV